MQMINRTVSTAVLLALVTAGISPPKCLAQIYRLTTGSGRANSMPDRTSISTIDHALEDRYLELLQRPIDCNFQETTLAAVAEYMQRETAVPMQFDKRALEDAGVGTDTPVSFRASQLPARTALTLILSQLDLTLLAKSRVILITTRDKASTELQTRVYPVADLVNATREVQQECVASQDFDSLIDLITVTIAPQTWDNVGGPGTISAFGLKSALVISQTADVHEAIAGLLEVLRSLPSASSADVQSGIRRLTPSNSNAMQGNSQNPDLTRLDGAFPSWRIPRNHRD